MTEKDRIIILTKADHQTTPKYEMPPPLESEQRRGVMLPNGEINWTCPCLGGLPYGPCGFEFREFFGCLPQSKEGEEKDDSKKTEECFPKFVAMKECFKQFPKLYPDEGADVSPTSNEED